MNPIDKFQFLIGKVKTDGVTNYAGPTGEFQFLIGKVKTKPDRRSRAAAKDVSIPHR